MPKLPVGGTVGQEIQSAIQAGKEVTVHERQISAHGWTGYGYVITDPETGAGGYIIEGKGNGGFLVAFFLCAISFIAAVFIIPSAPLLGLFMLAWEALNFALWIDAIKNSQNESDFNKANAGYAIGAVLGVFEPGVAVAQIVKWFGLLTALFLTTYL